MFNLFPEERNILDYFSIHKIEPFQLEVKLLTETAKAPKKALEFDNGYDLFLCSMTDFIEDSDEQFDWHKHTTGCSQVKDEQGNLIGIDIHPGGFAKLPIGIATAFNTDYGAFVFDKSGVGNKGIKYLGGVIEATYRKSWWVMLSNIKTANEFSPINFMRLRKLYVDNTVRFLVGQKIAQVCFLPIGRPQVVIVDELDKTERESGFGSTGDF